MTESSRPATNGRCAVIVFSATVDLVRLLSPDGQQNLSTIISVDVDKKKKNVFVFVLGLLLLFSSINIGISLKNPI